ncbi:XrtB/PEP-CTERM-associated polysaccharide biosynthesis outer membrane protein EpsL [Nitrosovibrio tenuis]|uniref:Exopolysaccharide biosynthesis operon protein EpsL n=1 Tax=Nitrosovibrio tenuis TaxID=1233 RepID=A0A1H7FIL7_9PROT|nr:XrtB/PEP-CTERM-associated polysaccharide biosynthesis outer membrane protein EpsL [Nitrosovibrio tenuis]SEK25946.1 exopolysaccharide biosynthesis operon protein EpsL [Nitrosovibrio tenuis]
MLLNLSRCHRHCLAILFFACLLLIAQHAAADSKDTFNVTVGTNVLYDNNVFRISSSIDPTLLVGKPVRSDLIITSSATVSLTKLYGLQRFEATGNFVDNRYNNFDFLNFFAKNYTAAWNWSITPYFHGNLSTSHREALNNFANLTGFINSSNRNLRTDDNYRFDGVFEINRSWHIIGAVSRTKLTNSLLTVQDFDNTVLSFEGGMRYSLPSGSSLTYKFRNGLGDFYKRPEPIATLLFDTRFNDTEHDVQLVWPVTSKTSIDARAGHVERKHAHFSQRDFSGFVGNFNFNWAVTSKTRLTASWARDLSNFQTASNFQLSQFQLFSSSYVAINRFSLAPSWQISPKLALRLRYDYMIRDHLGAVIPLPENRHDSQHTGLIELDWQPTRTIFLSASLRRDHRASNLRGFDYDNAAASVAARLNF